MEKELVPISKSSHWALGVTPIAGAERCPRCEGLSWGGSKDKDGRPVPGERRQGPGEGPEVEDGLAVPASNERTSEHH